LSFDGSGGASQHLLSDFALINIVALSGRLVRRLIPPPLDAVTTLVFAFPSHLGHLIRYMQPAKTQDRPASPSDFTWYHSEGDDDAMKPNTQPSNPQPPLNPQPPRARVQRAGRGEKMAEALAFEKTDELGKPIKRLNKTAPSGSSGSSRRRAVKKQRIVPTVVVVSSDSDDDDTDFVATELATEPEDSEYESASSGVWPNEFEEVFPSNAEVRYNLLYFISF
jgi:hypothetical protein